MAEGSEQQQPIIIKKIKRGGHGGHHGGAWKVAFADFMTAMMAFFLVMWLVTQSPQIKAAVGGYFRNPGKFKIQGTEGVLKGSSSVIPLGSPDMGARKSKTSEESTGPTDVEKKEMTSAGMAILQQLKDQEAFQRLKKNIKLNLTSEGLRIILNESENSPAFFEPGSAKLLQKSAIILITIARELGKLDNRIVLEGHTDASYTSDNIYTNWELSADRANAARELMEVSGLGKNQIREVRGYANSFPMIEEDPTDARNRRVTVLVLYRSSELGYDQLMVGEDLMAEIESFN